jgi:hypothetical protein
MSAGRRSNLRRKSLSDLIAHVVDSSSDRASRFFPAGRGKNQPNADPDSYSRHKLDGIVEDVAIFPANRSGRSGNPAGRSFIPLLGSVAQIFNLFNGAIPDGPRGVVRLLK